MKIFGKEISLPSFSNPIANVRRPTIPRFSNPLRSIRRPSFSFTKKNIFLLIFIVFALVFASYGWLYVENSYHNGFRFYFRTWLMPVLITSFSSVYLYQGKFVHNDSMKPFMVLFMNVGAVAVVLSYQIMLTINVLVGPQKIYKLDTVVKNVIEKKKYYYAIRVKDPETKSEYQVRLKTKTPPRKGHDFDLMMKKGYFDVSYSNGDFYD